MMKAGWRVWVLVPLLVAAGGCRSWGAKTCHQEQPYAQAKSVPPLIIPAGLDAPDTTNALRLPQLTEPTPPPRTAKQPCLDEPPSFKVTQPPHTPPA
jgi:uncharacterized lipoprotein